MTLTASVCLCVYNGDPHLGTLFDSLRRQTRLPDEVVVSDDASSDTSPEIIERAEREIGVPFVYARNDSPLGITKNFEEVITRASRDVVFLCDQDDVWAPEKIEVLMAEFERDPAVLGAFSDSRLVGADGHPIGSTLWSTVGFSARDRDAMRGGHSLQVLLAKSVVAGHSLAFRSSSRPLILPLSTVSFYDSWIARLLAATGPFVPVDRVLVDYRIHDSNSLGVRRASALGRFSEVDPAVAAAREAAFCAELVERLDTVSPGLLSREDRQYLESDMSHLSTRASFPRSRLRRITPVAKEASTGRYWRHSNGVRSALVDLLWKRSSVVGSPEQQSGRARHSVTVQRDLRVKGREGPDGVRVAAVVVTYQPDLERLTSVLEAIKSQVEDIVVVDNASESRPDIEALVAGIPNARIEPLEKNFGIGAALNVGVDRVLLREPDWILTLDQDTIVHRNALGTLLSEFALLGVDARESCGVLALSREVTPSPGYVRQWIERPLVIAELERFRQLRCVITSGNLVRADLFTKVRYNEEFFMDQVDTIFCADVRRTGSTVLQYRQQTMDHRLGVSVDTRRGPRAYEGGIRLYYITRNKFSLVLRRDVAMRVFLRDVIGLSRVYLRVNGARSSFTLLKMVVIGLVDAVLQRFGPRDTHLRRSLSDDPSDD